MSSASKSDKVPAKPRSRSKSPSQSEHQPPTSNVTANTTSCSTRTRKVKKRVTQNGGYSSQGSQGSEEGHPHLDNDGLGGVGFRSYAGIGGRCMEVVDGNLWIGGDGGLVVRSKEGCQICSVLKLFTVLGNT